MCFYKLLDKVKAQPGTAILVGSSGIHLKLCEAAYSPLRRLSNHSTAPYLSGFLKSRVISPHKSWTLNSTLQPHLFECTEDLPKLVLGYPDSGILHSKVDVPTILTHSSRHSDGSGASELGCACMREITLL